MITDPAAPDLLPEPDNFLTKPKLLHIRAGELVQRWRRFEERAAEQRNLRTLRMTTTQAIEMKLILPSETFVGMRVVDDNITRELPISIKYLESSARQMIFLPIAEFPGFSAELLEKEFTTYSRYTGWRVPHLQIFDEAATLGWASVEVIYNPAQAAGVELEYIKHQDLIFNDQALRNLQQCDVIARRYRIAMYELAGMAQKYGFDGHAVKKLLGGATAENQATNIDIFKLFFRSPAGEVMCAWYSATIGEIFLRAPYLHTSGKFDSDGTPVPATEYPFFLLKYRITGETQITETEGRVDIDRHNQEAQTRLATSFINACRRACELYMAVKEDGKSRAETALSLIHGQIHPFALDFFSLPFPDSAALNALNAFNSRALQSAGQIDYAATNRQDSRKTATEISAAQGQAAEIAGISMFTFSEYALGVYAYIWDIVRYNALAGHNTFLGSMEPMARNMYLSAQYNLQPAGDVDYVERLAKLQRMLQMAPLYQNTPAWTAYLKIITAMAFPAESAELSAALIDTTGQLSASIIGILAQLPREALLAAIPPEAQADFNKILDESIRALNIGPTGAPGEPAAPAAAPPGGGGVPGGAPQPPLNQPQGGPAQLPG